MYQPSQWGSIRLHKLYSSWWVLSDDWPSMEAPFIVDELRASPPTLILAIGTFGVTPRLSMREYTVRHGPFPQHSLDHLPLPMVWSSRILPNSTTIMEHWMGTKQIGTVLCLGGPFFFKWRGPHSTLFPVISVANTNLPSNFFRGSSMIIVGNPTCKFTLIAHAIDKVSLTLIWVVVAPLNLTLLMHRVLGY